MKIKFSDRIFDLIGPIRIDLGAMMNCLHDVGTGWDYWFRTDDGSFDGTGRSGDDLTWQESEALMQRIKEMKEGQTKPIDEIEKKLN